MEEKIDLSKLSKLDRAQYKKVFLKLGWKFRDIEDLIAILGELSAHSSKITADMTSCSRWSEFEAKLPEFKERIAAFYRELCEFDEMLEPPR